MFLHNIKEVIDRIAVELQTRMDSARQLNKNFSFLHGVELSIISDQALKQRAEQLASLYDKDLNKEEFCTEMLVFRDHIKIKTDNLDLKKMNALDILNLLNHR